MKSWRRMLAPALCVCMAGNLMSPAYGSVRIPQQTRGSTQTATSSDAVNITEDGRNPVQIPGANDSDALLTNNSGAWTPNNLDAWTATDSDAWLATDSDAWDDNVELDNDLPVDIKAPGYTEITIPQTTIMYQNQKLQEEEIPIEKILLKDIDGNTINSTVYLNLDEGEVFHFQVETVPENATEGWHFKLPDYAEDGDYGYFKVLPCEDCGDNAYILTPVKPGSRPLYIWPDSVTWSNDPRIGGCGVQVLQYWYIVLDANGGSFDDGSETHTLRQETYQSFSLSGITPLREGYKFSGSWYNYPECTDTEAWKEGSTYSIDSDKVSLTRTLYAGWIECDRLENAEITLEKDVFTYSGSEIRPALTVTDANGKQLTEGIDYTVSADPGYGGNINAGTGAVLITAVPGSDYAGSLSKEFIIEKAELDIDIPEGPFQAVYGDSLGDVDLPDGWVWETPDQNVGSAGTSHSFAAWYQAEDSDNYNPKKAELKVTVVPYSLKDAELRFEDEKSTIYSGQEYRPAVSLWRGETEIPSNVYHLEYTDNVNAGAATVTAAAIGSSNYSDTVSGAFTILPADPEQLLKGCSFMAEYGTRLSAISLPNGWSWQEPDAFAGNTGSINTFPADYDADANQGNYTGKTGTNIAVQTTARSIAADEIKAVLDRESYLLTGTPITPEVTVTDLIFGNDGCLLRDTDYTLDYSDNDREGTGKVILTGIGNYKDTIELTFEIQTASYDIALAEISLNPDEAVYSGEPVCPDVTVVLEGKILQPGTDYELDYSGNTLPGFGSVTVTGTGTEGTFTYYNEQTVYFYIAPGSWKLTDAIYGSQLSETALPESWQWQEPDTFTGDVSKDGRLFSAVCCNNAEPQMRRTADFLVKVLPEDINDTDRIIITIEDANLFYDGDRPVRPAVTITDKKLGKTLTEGIDYEYTTGNDTGAGTAHLTITGSGNYSGTYQADYEIEKAENRLELPGSALNDHVLYMHIGQKPVSLNTSYLGDGKISLKSEQENVFLAELVQNGSARPNILITAVGPGEGTLTAAVSESKNYKEASCTITIIVEPAALTDAEITLAEGPYVYSGTQITPEFTVRADGRLLKENIDYTVTFGENIHAGKDAGTIEITGIGNYCGSASISFTIEKAVNPATPSDAELDAVYGQKQKELSLAGGWLWRYPESNVGDAGSREAEVFLAETADYLEKAWTVTINVAPKLLEDTMVSVDDSGLVYDGNAKYPKLHVSDGTLLTENDYQTEYKNNIHAGTGTVVITGRNNYRGTISRPFVIQKAVPELTIGAGTSITRDLDCKEFSLEAFLSNNGSLIYSSLDETVATVDKNGTVTLRKTGTAKISVAYKGSEDYQPVSAEVSLTVTQPSSDNTDNTGNSGNTGTPGSSDNSGNTSTPGNSDNSGNTGTPGNSGNSSSSGNSGSSNRSDSSVSERWVMKANGIWNFYDASGTMVKGRWMSVYNPYADTTIGQSAYDWFLFAQDGSMVTGWYQDEGNDLYYLNPVSDNTKGRMVTGWQLIDGIYYYFNEKSDGKKGRLLRSTITPDGFRVDETGARQENAAD